MNGRARGASIRPAKKSPSWDAWCLKGVQEAGLSSPPQLDYARRDAQR